MIIITVIIAVLALGYLVYPKITLKKPEIKYNKPLVLISIILISRAIYILIALVAAKEGFTNSFSRWDGGHYLFMAEHGYTNSGTGVEFIVFYPLFPLLIKLISYVVPSYLLSAFLVSNTSMVFAAVYLYKLTMLDLNETDSIYASALLLCFPFAFFLSGVYTESLFIMLTLMCFYYMRKQKWLLVGIFGLLASLSRVQGFLLIFPAVYEYFKSDNKKKGIFYCLLIPLGFIIYLCINKSVLGNWFAFLSYQRDIWYQQPSWFGNNLTGQVGYIQKMSELAYQIMLPQLVLFFGSMILLYAAAKRGMRLSYVIYSIPYIFMVYSASWLLSGGRYMMALFPIYIALPTIIKNKLTRITVLSASSMLLFVYTVLFVMGKNIM